jgi:putative peptidoglycan lipid II flippase
MARQASTPFEEGQTRSDDVEAVAATQAEAAETEAAAVGAEASTPSTPARATAGEEGGLGASAGPVTVATLASRLLGVVREQVVAALFGAGNAADAFNIAFRIPNLLRDLFAEGALSAAFVPTFTATMHKESKEAAWRLGAQVMNALFVVILCVVVAGWFFSPTLARLMAPGFAHVPGKLELTSLLARIMLPFLLVVALAAGAMGMLNSLRLFGQAAMAPVWFNVGSIVVTLAMVPVCHALGWEPVVSLAIGVLAGGVLQFALQVPPLWRAGFRPEWPPKLNHPGVRRIGLLMAPAAIGLSAVQINVVINSWLASTLGTGAVSWLAYAFRILFVPIGIFGVALATVSLPSLSRYAAENDFDGLKRTLNRAVRITVALTMPAAFGLWALGRPLTTLLYQHGHFTALDTMQTSRALAAYTVGLVCYSGIKVLVPAFYALGDTRTPLVASFISVAVNFGLNLFWMHRLGHVGLALSTGLTAIFNFCQLWLWLRGKIGGFGGRKLLSSGSRIFGASALMGAALFGFVWVTRGWMTHGLPGKAGVVGIGVALGGALTLVFYRLFQVEERKDLEAALTAVTRRVRWR